MAREPERIQRILAAIKTIWQRFPDWRLGQLLVNIVPEFEKNPFYLEDTIIEEKLTEFNEKFNENKGKVALEFTVGILLVIEKLIKEHHPFEYIGEEGKAIFILSREVAALFKNYYPFKCKELEIVSMSNLSREEANRIRKRHLK